MKNRRLYSILKFLFIVFILSRCAVYINDTDLAYNSKMLYAQDLSNKRILVYEYNNVKREYAGNNKYKLIMEMERPYKVEIMGNKIFNISGEDTICYSIQGIDVKKDYKGRAVGNSWVDYFTIDADSVVYDIECNFNMEMNADSVLFIKNDRIIAMSFNPKVYNEKEEKIIIDKVYKKNNKVVYKYSREDKSKSVKFDPTWSWRPTIAQEYDVMVDEANPTKNYNAADDYWFLDIGYHSAGTEERSYLLFEGLLDSLNSLGGIEIDSVVIWLERNNAEVGNLQIYVKRPTASWDPDVLTWNTQPALSTPYSDDTVACVYLDAVTVTTLTKAYYDSTYSYYGYCFLGVNQTSDNYTGYKAAEHPSAGKPKIDVWYTPSEDLGLDLSALSDSSIQCTVDTSKNGIMDSFIVMRSSDSSAIGDVFYTLVDTLDTLSINTRYSLIAGGYVNDSLTYFSFPDSMYTLAVKPESPFVQTWSAASLRIHPRPGGNLLSTKLAIYDSTWQRYIDSLGDTTATSVWQTEADWDSVVVGGRDASTQYTFGVIARNEFDSVTAISELAVCITNSTIDSVKVSAFTDSSYIAYFGNDTVYSPFQGYVIIDDSDSAAVSDTLDSFSYGIKSLVTNTSYSLNTLHRLRAARIENPGGTVYYSISDSAYTLTAKPTPPVISGTSDSTYLITFDDISGNPDSLEYAVFDSAYMVYRDTSGDTTSSVVFVADSIWNNASMKTFSPNVPVSIGIFSINSDSMLSEISSDTTWTFATVPGTTSAAVVDSTHMLLEIEPNGNPYYTYFAVEDSISGKFIDVSAGMLRSADVTVDSTWAFGMYSDWGGSSGYTVIVTPGQQYYFRAYAKDGNTNP